MRDPARIPQVLETVYRIWGQFPDLRLAQLIENVKRYEEADIYYLEDDELVRRLIDLYRP